MKLHVSNIHRYCGALIVPLLLSCQSATPPGTLILSDNMPLAWEYSTSTILEDGRRDGTDTTLVVFWEKLSKQDAGYIDNTKIISPIWRVAWFDGIDYRLFETQEGLFLANRYDNFDTATLFLPRRYEIGDTWKYSIDSWMSVHSEGEIHIGNKSYSTIVMEVEPHGQMFYWSHGVGVMKYKVFGLRGFPPETIIYVSEYIRTIPR